jgi:FkbM family methyltransferase
MVGRELYIPVEERCAKLRLGNERAEWCICPTGLSKESVVYSFGVGTDISFDLELIKLFGVRVHAFDPTPRAIAWVRSQNLPEEFIFHDYGIGGHDGSEVFCPPEQPGYVSYSVLPRGGAAAPLVEAPVHRLTTIMNMLGHGRVDVLKMDIEGAEYGVIEDFLGSDAPVTQLLVEFHHRWAEVGHENTRRAVRDLKDAGFRVFHVSGAGEECSFKRTESRRSAITDRNVAGEIFPPHRR